MPLNHPSSIHAQTGRCHLTRISESGEPSRPSRQHLAENYPPAPHNKNRPQPKEKPQTKMRA